MCCVTALLDTTVARVVVSAAVKLQILKTTIFGLKGEKESLMYKNWYDFVMSKMGALGVAVYSHQNLSVSPMQRDAPNVSSIQNTRALCKYANWQ